MNITRGIKQSAKKVIIYGTEGIGKSTFASKFPDPIFIDTEDSTKELDVARFDTPTSWPMLLQEVQYVIDHPKCCKTLILDTADWAERLEIEALCAKKGWSGLEDPGYGKGYQYSAEEFGKLLNKFSEVIERGVNVVVTAHAWLRKVELPDEIGDYDHWEMKTSKKVAPMLREWADMVLFANYKTIVVNVDGKGANKGKNKAQGGQRVMYTTHHPCWDAKNRYGLPDELPLDYEYIRHILEPENIAVSVTAPFKPEVRENITVPETAPVKPIVETPPLQTKSGPSIPDGIPKALADLMIAENISDEQIRRAIASQGYGLYDMPIKDYPKDFIEGCLIGAWDQLVSIIRVEDNDLPFVED